MNKLSKKQRAKLRRLCEHVLTAKMVTFKNGTKHVEQRCSKCGKQFGYLKQTSPALELYREKVLSYDDFEEIPDLEPRQHNGQIVFRG